MNQAVINQALARYGLSEPSPHDVLEDAFGDDTPDYRAHFRVVADTARSAVIGSCATCGGPILDVATERTRSNRMYCSRPCEPDHYTPEEGKICIGCGTWYPRTYQSLARWHRQKFCSDPCARAHRDNRSSDAGREAHDHFSARLTVDAYS